MAVKNILIAAGGTGGHIFPAEALAQELKSRGHKVYFATDVRGLRFAKNFPADEVKLIDGATVFSKSPLSLFKAMFKICKGIVQSLIFIRARKIDIVVGFGGYPSFAPLLAGKIWLKPIILHEANAVMGRANKLLAKFSHKVALGFPNTKYTDNIKHKTIFIGNPMRQSVRALKQVEYAAYTGDQKFNLLVFGGSQGAQVFNDVLPAAMALLPDEVRHKIKLTQQVSESQMAMVDRQYDAMKLDATLAPFFNDMPQLIADSHLVISRAGATTIAELCYIGRPSILVPLPGALDADQANNAKNVADINGGWLCVQKEFTAEYLSAKIIELMNEPTLLAEAALQSKNLGQPKAAENLANLVEQY